MPPLTPVHVELSTEKTNSRFLRQHLHVGFSSSLHAGYIQYYCTGLLYRLNIVKVMRVEMAVSTVC
jgi:hypothetical protein